MFIPFRGSRYDRKGEYMMPDYEPEGLDDDESGYPWDECRDDDLGNYDEENDNGD